ncbi:MAG TPA: 1-acyl-sn-glycerol-3-phosphate acyltransferase [Oculatellaceae cyanobacterium]
MNLTKLFPLTKFTDRRREYIRSVHGKELGFGYDIRQIAQAEPLLSFLFEEWWRVQVASLERLPKQGPALIVGNTSGLVPWPAMMLMYALMRRKTPRRLNIVADMDWVDDEAIRSAAIKLGFVPWSSENLKSLLNAGELVAIFPEGIAAASKPFSERYRVREFDWTRLLPAIEEGVQIYPLATVGCDEAIPNILTADCLKKLVGLPALPVTPFFPWLPFPLNFASFPVQWYMSVAKPVSYKTTKDRDALEELAKKQTKFVQGEIQAEINRLLRGRIRSYV